jgi:hypothetical protein
MKKIIIISTIILIVLNVIAKLIITNYDWFNLVLSSLVLVSNAILLYALSNPKIADGFRVAMSFIYSFVGALLFILSQFSIIPMQDNWIILVIIVVTGFEWMLLVLFRVVSKVTK